MLRTDYYDDGSSLTWDPDSGYHSATPAAANAYTANNSSGFPSGSDLQTALAYGFGKYIDYKTTPNKPQNTTALYSNAPDGAPYNGFQLSPMMLILGLGAVAAVVLLAD